MVIGSTRSPPRPSHDCREGGQLLKTTDQKDGRSLSSWRPWRWRLSPEAPTSGSATSEINKLLCYFPFAAIPQRSILDCVFYELCPRRLPYPLASRRIWPNEALGRSVWEKRTMIFCFHTAYIGSVFLWGQSSCPAAPLPWLQLSKGPSNTIPPLSLQPGGGHGFPVLVTPGSFPTHSLLGSGILSHLYNSAFLKPCFS